MWFSTLRSHLCAVIASLHLEFAYSEYTKSEKREHFAHICSLTAYSTPNTAQHRRRVCVCEWVSVSWLFFVRTNSFACGAFFCFARSIRSIPAYYLTRCICLSFSFNFFPFFFFVFTDSFAVVTWNNFLIPITLWYPQWIELICWLTVYVWLFIFFGAPFIHPFTMSMYRFLLLYEFDSVERLAIF